MKATAMLRMTRDELYRACREERIRARSGVEALAALARRWGGNCDYAHLICGRYAYRHTPAMWEFALAFNSGHYPELDDPETRSIVIAQGTREEQAESMARAMDALGEDVGERLLDAGCFGETPEDALAAWLRMYLCGDVVVRDGNAEWLGVSYPLAQPLKEFIESWDKYPGLHFVIPKQLGS